MRLIYLISCVLLSVTSVNSQIHCTEKKVDDIRSFQKKGNVVPTSLLWPNSIIYYQKNITHSLKDRILSAMEHISSNTNLCFREGENDQYRLVFHEQGQLSGATYVGNWDGNFETHDVTLGSQISEPDIIHELLHCAGLYHEHNRPDREQYITVDPDNIAFGSGSQYMINGTALGNYDFYSIMHYPPVAHAIPGKLTYTLMPGYEDLDGIVGYATGMSAGDIEAINQLYPMTCQAINGVDLEASCGSLTVLQTGSQLDISNLEISNNGSAASTPFTIGYYLSSTNNPNESTPINLGFQNIGIVNSGETQSVPPISFDVNSITNGFYYLLIGVDAINVTNDAYYGNNSCFSQMSFQIGGCSTTDGEIAGNFTGSYEFSAPQYLIAPVSGNTCVINNGANMTLSAGRYIDLQPGFITHTGGFFTTAIDDCTHVSDLLEKDQPLDLIQVKQKSDIAFANPTAEKNIPIEKTALLNVSPNPLRDIARIEFTLPETTDVNLALFNVEGKMIFDLISSDKYSEGTHQYKFTNPNVNPGLYVLQLSYGDTMLSKKLIIK